MQKILPRAIGMSVLLATLVTVLACKTDSGDDSAGLAAFFALGDSRGISAPAAIERVPLRTDLELPAIPIKALLQPSNGAAAGPLLLLADDTIQDTELYPVSDHIVLASMAQTSKYFVLHYTGQAVSCALVLISKAAATTHCAWTIQHYETELGASSPPGQSVIKIENVIEKGDAVVVTTKDAAYEVRPDAAPVKITAGDVDEGPCKGYPIKYKDPGGVIHTTSCYVDQISANSTGDLLYIVTVLGRTSKTRTLWMRDGVTGTDQYLAYLSDKFGGYRSLLYYESASDTLKALNTYTSTATMHRIERNAGALVDAPFALTQTATETESSRDRKDGPLVHCGPQSRAYYVHSAAFNQDTLTYPHTNPNGLPIFAPMMEAGDTSGRTFNLVFPLMDSAEIKSMACGVNRLYISTRQSDTNIQGLYHLLAGAGAAQEIISTTDYEIMAMETNTDDGLLIAAVRNSDGKNIVGSVALNGALNVLAATPDTAILAILPVE